MADPLLPVDPLRLRHSRGEALLGRDFADQSAQEDQLRWWHNRALHRAYGVTAGLEVTFIPPPPATPDVAVVAPGIAYDCHGRELILDQPRRIPVPAGTETRYLVLSRHAGAASGVTLRWLPPDTAATSDGVRLTATGPDAPVVNPPQARPMARPRIGRGATIPGATAWQPWVEAIREPPWNLGVQVEIDTSAAVFTAAPCYFAQLTGRLWHSTNPLLLLVPFDHIAKPSKDRFTFRLLMPWLYLPVIKAPHGLAQITTDLAVTWIGIQHRSAGDGDFHLAREQGRT